MDTNRFTTTKKILEAIALPIVAALLLRLWTGSHFGYPWWWLAPLAIALRYGVAYGVGSSLVLVLANLLAGHYQSSPLPLSSGEIIGGFIATYLAGLYAGHYRNRLTEANARLEYLEHRLESLTRVFYVTRLSHSRLEESLITKSDDLRSALTRIAEEIGSDFTPAHPMPHRPLQDLLQLLAFHGRINDASIFQFVDGRVRVEPAADLGSPFQLDVGDPLVRKVVEDQVPAYHSVDQILGEQASAYRVVLPMVAADQTLLALIVVAEMPLLALNEENLLTMAAMAAYVADALHGEHLSHEVRSVLPACPGDFALDWRRLGHLRQRARVHSSWVQLIPGDDARKGIAGSLVDARRGLDRYWPDMDGTPESRLMVLLPLSGEGAVEGFLQRVDDFCSKHFGGSLSTLGWSTRHGEIVEGSAAELAALVHTDTAHAG